MEYYNLWVIQPGGEYFSTELSFFFVIGKIASE